MPALGTNLAWCRTAFYIHSAWALTLALAALQGREVDDTVAAAASCEDAQETPPKEGHRGLRLAKTSWTVQLAKELASGLSMLQHKASASGDIE
eukprot:3761708-Amphidinium_carterae.1